MEAYGDRALARQRSRGLRPEQPVDLPFARRLVAVARSVGAHPFDLANLISFESAGTFHSAVKNPSTGATGLIQFLGSTAKQLLGAPSKEAALQQMASMSNVDQLDYVERFLRTWSRKFGPLDRPPKLFMAVFMPAAIPQPETRKFIRMKHASGKPFVSNPDRFTQANPSVPTPRAYADLVEKYKQLPSSIEVA